MKSSITRFAVVTALILAGVAWAKPPASAGKWDKETLDTLSSVPVQELGRIKPLSTFAAFKLLKINGKRTYTTESKEYLSPMEWLLDCLYYPEVASDYSQFLLDNSDAITMIGVTAHAKLRDRYSYNEIVPARMELFNLAKQFSAIDPKQQTQLQRLILSLATNVQEFEMLIHYMDFARHTYSPGEGLLMEKIFPGKKELAFSDVMAKGPDLRKAIQALLVAQDEDKDGANKERYAAEEDSMLKFMGALEQGTGFSMAIALIPPSDSGNKQWMNPADMPMLLLQSQQPLEQEAKVLAAMERMATAVGNDLTFKQEAKAFSDLVVAGAKSRGEYSKVPIEVTFYNAKFFFYAQWGFVLSFVLVAVTWLNLGSKILGRASVVAVLIPWGLLVTGIVYRCIIRNRPPISTLYETILFITAAVVLVALLLEWLNRQRVAIAIAAFMGTAGLFIANNYELNDKQDTMPSLQAVLNTNFWLATHVTIVIVGYAAGLLAAGIAHVYIFSKLFKFRRDDTAYYKNLTRMVYGIACFGLLFSFVGTVLGGIWANYSWGRFWGWDPKENGALMIVLWNLVILHSRMGGYIRDLGLSMMAVFGGMIVAFSWWGVNLLGVGLHSYGFTSGIWGLLSSFWVAESVVILIAAYVYFRDRGVARATKRQPPPDLSVQSVAK